MDLCCTEASSSSLSAGVPFPRLLSRVEPLLDLCLGILTDGSDLLGSEFPVSLKLLKIDDPPVPSTKNSPEKCSTFCTMAKCPANFLFGVIITVGTDK